MCASAIRCVCVCVSVSPRALAASNHHNSAQMDQGRWEGGVVGGSNQEKSEGPLEPDGRERSAKSKLDLEDDEEEGPKKQMG